MTVFTAQQSEILAEFAQELKTTFQKHAEMLGEKFVEMSTENAEKHNEEIRRVMVHGDNLNHNYEMYAARVIQEVRVNEEATKLRHIAYIRELRISSIVALCAAGRGMDTAIMLVESIEERLTNLENFSEE